MCLVIKRLKQHLFTEKKKQDSKNGYNMDPTKIKWHEVLLHP